MVVGDVSGACDDVLEVGVAALVLIIEAERLCRGDVSWSVEHIERFVFRLEADVSVVGDMKLCSAASLGLYLDDTGGSTRTVLCGLGSVFEDGETLDVGGIYRRKGTKVGIYTVDDHEWVVAAGDGRGASHTHRAELCHTVLARCDVHTGCLPRECIERIGDQTFVHVVFGHHIDRSQRGAVDGEAVYGYLQFNRSLAMMAGLRHQRAGGETEKQQGQKNRSAHGGQFFNMIL